MVLMRAPLGRRGSSLPTAVDVVQTLGWTVFELLVIIFDGPAWRPGSIAAWVAGFALYQWLYPTGPQ